jgi:hypothetical protein
MAENEVLDVGSRRRYKVWKRLLADSSVPPEAVADCLADEFAKILQGKLRRNPLYLVLRACRDQPDALSAVVSNFKDRALARLVHKAYLITRSSEPRVVAQKIAELLIDSLIDRSNRYALRQDKDVFAPRRAALDSASAVKLQVCRPQIVEYLVASLTNAPIPRRSRAATVRPAVETSLLRREPETV